MDDLESRAIENIHNYLKECLDQNDYNTKVEEKDNADDASLIYTSLKKYILRLININNFIKQENYFLRKKSETLNKENNENIIKIAQNKKCIHSVYLDEIKELNNENEFIKYKFQKMLREHISLERDNVNLNNSLLNERNLILNKNFENKRITLKNNNADIKPNISKLYENENDKENDNLKYLNNMNLISFEKKFERICKCANILEDILNVLNSSIKYDESAIFQKKVENMKIEKEELIMQNSFLKEKVLEIETFILNDPFLVEKFNFLYDSKNISYDQSVKNNFKLYKNNNKKMLYTDLCSLEKKNLELREELSRQKRENRIYRGYMRDVGDKLKKDLTELFKLRDDKNISYNNFMEIYNTNNYLSKNEKTFYLNFYDTKTKSDGLSGNQIKNTWEFNSELSNVDDSKIFSMFKIAGTKIDYNQKRLTYACRKIKELEEEINDLKVCFNI